LQLAIHNGGFPASKDMGVRSKFAIYLILWCCLGLFFLFRVVHGDYGFLSALVLLQVAIGTLFMKLKCSHCGRKIMFTRIGIAGMGLGVRAWPPKRCPDCHQEIQWSVGSTRADDFLGIFV